MAGLSDPEFPAHVLGFVDPRHTADFDNIVESAIAAGLEEDRSWRNPQHHSFAGRVATESVFRSVERLDNVKRLVRLSPIHS
jgi:hypothetical protein